MPIKTAPFEDVQTIKGITFPGHITFRQLLITGPPGSGKTTLINRLRGWSEEGYIDLSLNKWWTAQSLCLRPREIHLGFPFVGHEKALAVFEKEWLEPDIRPELDLERIKLPPKKKYFFSVDWQKRYVFDFLVPPAELVLERRLERSKRGTHHVDKNLELDTIQAQTEVYRRTALYLHQSGLTVYLREDIDGAPLQIIVPEYQPMAKQSSKLKNKFIERLKESFFGLEQCKNLNLTEAYRLEEKKVRLKTENYPIQLNLGPEGKMLHIYPERPINHSRKGFQEECYIIFDPKTYYNGASGFLRISEGEKLILGESESKVIQKDLLNLPSSSINGYLSIINKDGTLIFKAIDAKHGACISPLLKEKQLHRISRWRQAKLKRLRSIFGGPIKLLPADDALSLIQRVNKEMESEVYRVQGANKKPGGVVELPSDITPLLIGDLHAKVDNLLVILSQSGFLKALKKGRASLVIVGDAVHCEDKGKLKEMNSSMLIMDLIFKLKLRFPQQVFYLRGNHDSFSEEIGKQGVPQGLLWEKALIKTRGMAYRDEMARFYKSLPYIAYSKNFIACHAGPPTSSTSRKELINIHSHEHLMHEVTNNRVRRPNSPTGYFKKEVKKLRKYFKLTPETPVIVGHTPLTDDDTLWERVGDIDNHYVIYGGHDQCVGVITQVADQVYPFRYPVEQLIPLINAIEN